MFEDYVSHFEELRRRLLTALAVWALASLACWFFSHQLIEFLTEPLRRFRETQLFFDKPYEAFLTHLKAAMLCGLIISSPVILTQIWFFVAPGLYPGEKKILLPLAGASVLLFLAGVFFAYAVAVPWGLGFLLEFQTASLRPLIGIGPYFSFLTGMILAFGLLFDFPVFVVGLVRLGVVSVQTLEGLRRPIIVILFVVAAILTPSPDPVSQMILALPLWLLFEVSLRVARRSEKPA